MPTEKKYHNTEHEIDFINRVINRENMSVENKTIFLHNYLKSIKQRKAWDMMNKENVRNYVKSVLTYYEAVLKAEAK